MDPHHFGNLDSHPDPHLHPDPHQSDKLDPEPDPDTHNIADDKPKRMEYEPSWALLKGLSLYLEASIWIRIRVKSRIQIRICIK